MPFILSILSEIARLKHSVLTRPPRSEIPGFGIVNARVIQGHSCCPKPKAAMENTPLVNASTDSESAIPEAKLIQYINLRLAALGLPTCGAGFDPEIADLLKSLLLHQREEGRLLADHLAPADRRIQNFLFDYLQDEVAVPKLPGRTFVLDRVGLARAYPCRMTRIFSLPRSSPAIASGTACCTTQKPIAERPREFFMSLKVDCPSRRTNWPSPSSPLGKCSRRRCNRRKNSCASVHFQPEGTGILFRFAPDPSHRLARYSRESAATDHGDSVFCSGRPG